MKKQQFGVVASPIAFPLADFGYIIPADLGPVITAYELRAIGKEAIEEFQAKLGTEPEPKPQGRRADNRVSYMDTWAQRYWRSQANIERGRLLVGKAKHRAHREPLPVKSPGGVVCE
jgi:hypothetical protein